MRVSDDIMESPYLYEGSRMSVLGATLVSLNETDDSGHSTSYM